MGCNPVPGIKCWHVFVNHLYTPYKNVQNDFILLSDYMWVDGVGEDGGAGAPG